MTHDDIKLELLERIGKAIEGVSDAIRASCPREAKRPSLFNPDDPNPCDGIVLEEARRVMAKELEDHRCGTEYDSIRRQIENLLWNNGMKESGKATAVVDRTIGIILKL